LSVVGKVVLDAVDEAFDDGREFVVGVGQGHDGAVGVDEECGDRHGASRWGRGGRDWHGGRWEGVEGRRGGAGQGDDRSG